MNLESIKLAPLFMACCVVCILATSNSFKPSVDKIINYKIDTVFHQNNPVKKPSPLFIDADIKIELEKKSKKLSTKEFTMLNSLIEDNNNKVQKIAVHSVTMERPFFTIQKI